MNNLYPNDQAYIAKEFFFIDAHIAQTSRLAFLKINSYKLSLINAAFCMSRDELASIIKNSLFNYTKPETVLADQGFFSAAMNN